MSNYHQAGFHPMLLRPRPQYDEIWYRNADHPWMNRFCYIGTLHDYNSENVPGDVKRNFEVWARTHPRSTGVAVLAQTALRIVAPPGVDGSARGDVVRSGIGGVRRRLEENRRSSEGLEGDWRSSEEFGGDWRSSSGIGGIRRGWRRIGGVRSGIGGVRRGWRGIGGVRRSSEAIGF